jgi:hypothetical protein
MVTLADDNVNESLLRAFDRLFEKAIVKLKLECSDDERKEARASFALRFREALELINNAGAGGVSAESLHEMESAIDDLTPAHIAGYIAVGPLAVHLHKLMRSIATKAAEQRLIEDLINQADDRYGGN